VTPEPRPSSAPQGTDEQDGSADPSSSALSAIAVSPAMTTPLVGECVDVRHPTLLGRVLVRWDAGVSSEQWLAVLQGLAVRVADRVLLLKPANWAEPLVVGVVDGFARRPEPRRTTAAEIALLPDESLRVTGADGATLIEVLASPSGPVVKLAQPDVTLELPGALRLSARSIELRAREGAATVTATGDVDLRGETINLNS